MQHLNLAILHLVHLHEHVSACSCLSHIAFQAPHIITCQCWCENKGCWPEDATNITLYKSQNITLTQDMYSGFYPYFSSESSGMRFKKLAKNLLKSCRHYQSLTTRSTLLQVCIVLKIKDPQNSCQCHQITQTWVSKQTRNTWRRIEYLQIILTESQCVVVVRLSKITTSEGSTSSKTSENCIKGHDLKHHYFCTDQTFYLYTVCIIGGVEHIFSIGCHTYTNQLKFLIVQDLKTQTVDKRCDAAKWENKAHIWLSDHWQR